MDIIVNARVVNKAGEKGKIIRNDGQRLLVEFPFGRTVKYAEDAFAKGFLSYEDDSLQQEVELEKKRLEEEKQKSLEAVKEADSLAKERLAKLKEEKEKEAKEKKEKEKKEAMSDDGPTPRVILLRRRLAHAKQGANLKRYVTIDVDSKKMKSKKGAQVVAYDFHNDFSPLCIGPVTMGDGLVAPNMELAWQCSKVFPCHACSGVPNNDYLEWRKSCYENPPTSEADMRTPWKDLGYERRGTHVNYKDHEVCFYAFYDSREKRWKGLTIAELRRKFLQAYVQVVSRTSSYAYLKKLLKEGKNIALMGDDVFNYASPVGRSCAYEYYVSRQTEKKLAIVYDKKMFEEAKTLAKLFALPLPLGHAAIIKAMLIGALSLDKNGNLIDNAGILSSMTDTKEK